MKVCEIALFSDAGAADWKGRQVGGLGDQRRGPQLLPNDGGSKERPCAVVVDTRRRAGKSVPDITKGDPGTRSNSICVISPINEYVNMHDAKSHDEKYVQTTFKI
jgi:hypothetical protein